MRGGQLRSSGTRPVSPIHRRDAQLQHGRQRNPEEVRKLCQGNPAVMPPHGDNAPDDCRPHDHDVNRRQWQVSHPKLNRCENQICHEVDGEWKDDDPADLPSDRLHEDKPEADQDDRVKNLPDQADGRRGGRPAWFGERVVPFDPDHRRHVFLRACSSSADFITLRLQYRLHEHHSESTSLPVTHSRKRNLAWWIDHRLNVPFRRRACVRERLGQPLEDSFVIQQQ